MSIKFKVKIEDLSLTNLLYQNSKAWLSLEKGLNFLKENKDIIILKNEYLIIDYLIRCLDEQDNLNSPQNVKINSGYSIYKTTHTWVIFDACIKNLITAGFLTEQTIHNFIVGAFVKQLDIDNLLNKEELIVNLSAQDKKEDSWIFHWNVFDSSENKIKEIAENGEIIWEKKYV